MAAELIANSIELTFEQQQKYQLNNFRILGALQLTSRTSDDKPLEEFSGLAWDQDEKTLYALSDRGYIVHLKPVFDEDRLINVELIGYYPLKDKSDKKLTGSYSDSEGLALLNSNNNKTGDTTLLISFERTPRIIEYDLKGNFLLKHSTNKQLVDIKNYAGSNKSLEALTLHKSLGVIIAPERPLRSAKEKTISLYSKDKALGEFMPTDEEHGSLVGLTTLPDQRVIALERIFANVFTGLTTVIHLLDISNEKLQQKKLLTLLPVDGVFNDNFEGISWHKKNRFFMISDDNANNFQRSVLVYFEISKGLENED